MFRSAARRSSSACRRGAGAAAAAACGLVVVFALFGRLILDYLHVSVESLTIAGGLLLLLVALQMLRGEEIVQPETANIALVPLATPLLAGPGAIAAIMVQVQRYQDLPDRVAVLAAVVAMIVVIAFAMLTAGAI